MAKLPAMPFFPADFFADTEHMRPEAAKAYLFLLGHAWIRGAKLPNDDGALARMARLSPRAWAGVKVAVLEMWVTGTDGYLRNDRLTREYEFVCAKSQKNRANGSLGGRSKSQKSQAQARETCAKNANEFNGGGLAKGTAPTLTLIPREDSDSSLRSESAAQAPPPRQNIAEIIRDQVWQEGVPIVMAHGLTEKQARGLIGRALQHANGEAMVVLDVLHHAKESPPESIQAWMVGSVKARITRRKENERGKRSANQEFWLRHCGEADSGGFDRPLLTHG